MSYAICWEEYLAWLCVDRWALEPAKTIEIIKRIDSLVGPGVVDDASVAAVLQRGGVGEAEAGFMAPRICQAIGS